MNAKSDPKIKTPQPPPFCCDCRHFLSADGGANALDGEHRCERFPTLDLVTGKKFHVACNLLRSPDAPCGDQGKLFERKASDPTPSTPPTDSPANN